MEDDSEVDRFQKIYMLECAGPFVRDLLRHVSMPAIELLGMEQLTPDDQERACRVLCPHGATGPRVVARAETVATGKESKQKNCVAQATVKIEQRRQNAINSSDDPPPVSQIVDRKKAATPSGKTSKSDTRASSTRERETRRE